MTACKHCIHYDVCLFRAEEETQMTVNECSHYAELTLIKMQAQNELAERIKAYYNALKGTTASACVTYTIDQIVRILNEKNKGGDQT